MSDRMVSLPDGAVRVRESGQGAPVVFIHGVLVDSRLWDGVVADLAGSVRCIQPDLPFGAHRTAMHPDATLKPAKLIADLLEELDLHDVTLVGNDSGGAFCQMVAAYYPERVGRLVLTNCDAYDEWPPDFFWPLFWTTGKIPGAMRVVAETMRLRLVREGPIGLGRLASSDFAQGLTADWLEPLRRDAGIRRDMRKLIQGIDRSEMLAVAEQLQSYDRPVQLVWGTEDPFFKPELGRRIADGIPGAQLEEVPGARCFVPLDAPGPVADAIRRSTAERERQSEA